MRTQKLAAIVVITLANFLNKQSQTAVERFP